MGELHGYLSEDGTQTAKLEVPDGFKPPYSIDIEDSLGDSRDQRVRFTRVASPSKTSGPESVDIPESEFNPLKITPEGMLEVALKHQQNYEHLSRQHPASYSIGAQKLHASVMAENHYLGALVALLMVSVDQQQQMMNMLVTINNDQNRQ